MMKASYLTGAAMLALFAATPTFAQTAPAAPAAEAASTDEAQPGDIIVTAQKRSERLQDVPLAVTVVSGDSIGALGKTSIEGAQYLVPTLTFIKSGTTLNQSIFLRGVGTSTFSIAGEPSVSTVIDGVVYARPGEAFGDLIDIDRLEVLPGPQGTLFGKNASAGVINVVSKKPTQSFGGYGEAGYFSDSEYRLRGVINVPLSQDVRTRLTGFYDTYDGNIRNVTTKSLVNGFEHYGGRLQVDADPTSTLKLSFIADYHHNNDDCCAVIVATAPINATTGQLTTGLSSSVLPTPKGVNTREVAQNFVTSTKETGYGFSLQGDLDLGGVSLTSITSYRNYKNTEIRDGDWLPQAYIGYTQIQDTGPQTGNTVTQELRLTSPGHQLVDYVLGAYYSRAESERVFTRTDQSCTAVGATPTTLTPCSSPLANASTFPTGTGDFGSVFNNLAFFGQGTLNLTPRFRLIGGARYSIDKLSVFDVRRTTLAGAGIAANFDQGVFDEYTREVAAGISPTTALTQSLAASNGVAFRTHTNNNNLSGKAGAQFDLSRTSTLYGTYSRGYKGPAYNVFFNLTATGTNVIAPETSNAFEVGLKNTLFGGKLTLNLAAFYAKYNNFQANNPDLVAGVVVTRFTNAGKVSTRGGQLDLSYRPVRDLNIAGGVAYTDARVDQFYLPVGGTPGTVVPNGTPLGNAPRWKGNLSADYRVRTGGSVDPFFGAQASYQSEQLSLFAANAVQRQLGTVGAYALVNLSVGLVSKDERYRLTFQVRNLFDKAFAAAIANGGPDNAYLYQITRDADRYFGVTGRVGF
jgi:iron complex outermembrane receptor protein